MPQCKGRAGFLRATQAPMEGGWQCRTRRVTMRTCLSFRGQLILRPDETLGNDPKESSAQPSAIDSKGSVAGFNLDGHRSTFSHRSRAISIWFDRGGRGRPTTSHIPAKGSFGCGAVWWDDRDILLPKKQISAYSAKFDPHGLPRSDQSRILCATRQKPALFRRLAMEPFSKPTPFLRKAGSSSRKLAGRVLAWWGQDAKLWAGP